MNVIVSPRLRLLLIVTLGAGLAGCVSSGGRHASTPDRRPAMPTVALPTAAERMPADARFDEVVAEALRAARNNNTEGAVRAVASLGDHGPRMRAAQRVTMELAASDPKTGARVGWELANAFQQPSLAEAAMGNLVRREPDYALRWVTELPDGAANRRVRLAAVEQFVAAEGRAALNRIGALPAGVARDELLVLAAAAWTRRDPDAAIAWLRDQPDSELKPRLTSSVGFEVAHSKPERALEVADMLPEGRNRWLLFSAIGQTWVAVDSKAALSWASKLPAGEPRDAAFAGIDTGYGMPVRRRAPTAPGSRGIRTRGGAAAVAAVQAEANSPDFEAWRATQRKDMTREEAILEYVRQRGALQPGVVGPMIQSLPMGPTREHATAIYLDGLLIGSPAEAARWVRSLPRSERTDELVEKAARQLINKNPDAAAEFVEQSNLPGYMKDRLLRDANR
jgi:hypothetical protein